MSRNRDNISFDQVLEKINSYIEDEKELQVINDAYELARSKHEGQYRKTGEAYIIHPLNVALILTEIYADYETISAGLLHDVLEDCQDKLPFGGNELVTEYGLSQEVKNRSNYALSFSRFTFPHQLMRLIFVEQLYRAFTIINNQEYHK